MPERDSITGKSIISSRDDYLLSIFSQETDSLRESMKIIEEISKKHDLNLKQISELLNNKERYASVPIGLYRSKLAPLEVTVRYLKDILEFNFTTIAKMLSRDETTIWTTYNNSIRKSEKIIVDLEMDDIDFRRMKVKRHELVIPVDIFSERRLSILESLCVYLRETFSLNYRNIGLLVDRNERTVWTAVNRARKKLK